MNVFSPRTVVGIAIAGHNTLRFIYSNGTYSTHNVIVWSTEKYADSVDISFKSTISSASTSGDNSLEIKDLSFVKVGQLVTGLGIDADTLVSDINEHNITLDKDTISDIPYGSELTFTTLGGEESLNGSMHFTQDGAIQGLGVTGLYFDSNNPLVIDGVTMNSITEVRDYFVANLGI